jgi:Cof subfamily protein (haloacid dehalogenase superfamily)
MIQLIATDLDESLLNSRHQISEKDKQAIRGAVSRGVKFVLATGRGYTTVRQNLVDLGLWQQAGQYVISFNGAMITENQDSRPLFFRGMDFDTVDALFRRGLAFPELCLHVYTRDIVYIWNYTALEREFVEGRMEIRELEQPSIDFLREEPLVKTLYMHPSVDHLKQVREEVRDLTAGVAVSYSSNRYLEFNRRGVDKGAGLKRLCRLAGIPLEDTLAMGDNLNDLSMIRAAGIGVGVKNASPDIAGQCDVILNATNDEDPMSEVIARFLP